MQVILSKIYNHLPGEVRGPLGECKDRSDREASRRRGGSSVGLGKAGFPRSSEKTLKQSVHMQEFEDHIDLGSNPSSPLAS